jgi:hypothetical protein
MKNIKYNASEEMGMAAKNWRHINIRVAEEIKKQYDIYLLLKDGKTMQSDLEEHILSCVSKIADMRMAAKNPKESE